MVKVTRNYDSRLHVGKMEFFSAPNDLPGGVTFHVIPSVKTKKAISMNRARINNQCPMCLDKQ